MNRKTIVTALMVCFALSGCGGGSSNYGGDSSNYGGDSSNYCLITWEDSDGTVLRTDHVKKGETPTYGEDPEKEMEKYETYSFAGWEPAITPASCDMTYKATYETHASENEFIVKLDSNGGQEFSVTLAKKKGATLTLPDVWPYKEGYLFLGWSSIYEETIYGADDEFNGDFNVYLYADWRSKCARCRGTGRSLYDELSECPKCNGTGKTSASVASSTGQIDCCCSCSYCYGTGISWAASKGICGSCEGSGYTLEDGPKIEKVTSSTITLAETEGYEYGIDDHSQTYGPDWQPSWQASPTFSDLTAEVTYRFYQRKAAKGKVPHGFTSKATSATTLRSSYFILYILNGGINNPDNPSSYSYESEDIILKDPSREGYAFKGWYRDGSFKFKVTDIPSGSSEDLALYAKWTANSHRLTVEPENETRGTVTVSGKGYTDEEITVTAKVSTTYAFKGWYSNGYFASSKNPYTFRMPSRDVSLTAVFMTKSESEETTEGLTDRQKAGIDQAINIERGTITYGLYPQTHVSDEVLISSLNKLKMTESNGWYLYDGSYYAKKSAIPYNSSYEFSDGTKIVEGTEYWFKCEPIEWEILSLPSNGTYSLVSSLILDAHRYHSSTEERTIDGEIIYANNYEHSDIRKWLIGDFYKAAFALDDSLIQTVTVDNSYWSGVEFLYACGDTEDKVYLPSYRDYATSYVARQCKPTDWAKANYACYYTGSRYYDCYGYGSYWTRSPARYIDMGDSYYAICVDYSGYLRDYGDRVYFSENGVRPSLSIKIV